MINLKGVYTGEELGQLHYDYDLDERFFIVNMENQSNDSFLIELRNRDIFPPKSIEQFYYDIYQNQYIWSEGTGRYFDTEEKIILPRTIQEFLAPAPIPENCDSIIVYFEYWTFTDSACEIGLKYILDADKIVKLIRYSNECIHRKRQIDQ
ncbi:MAG: hypothetical protein R2828_15420 [Saprospiraceae bacterium]